MIANARTSRAFGAVLRGVLHPDRSPQVLLSQELFSRLDHERGAWMVTREMEGCAMMSARVVLPVYHLTLYWHPADAPTPPQMAATAKRFLRDLGLLEHQAVAVRHRDAAMEHVHLVVNRVHPDTHKAWAPGLHRLRLPPICRAVEREMGLRAVPAGSVAAGPRPTANERSAGRRTGIEPLVTVVYRHCGDRLLQAVTWEAFGAILAEFGYTFAAGRGGVGLVIGDGGRQAAASRVDRQLSRPRLEGRFAQPLDDFLARRADEVVA